MRNREHSPRMRQARWYGRLRPVRRPAGWTALVLLLWTVPQGGCESCGEKHGDLEICGNGLDDDGDQLVDCDDSECAFEDSCTASGDGDVDGDVDSDVDTDGGTDGDPDGDPDGDVNGDGGGDADGDVEEDADIDIEAEPLRCGPDDAEAVYTNLFDSALYCTRPERPLWSQLYFEAVAPSGTEIHFCGRTAERFSRLGIQPVVDLGTVPGDTSPIDVQDAFESVGRTANERYFELGYSVVTSGGAEPAVTSLDLIFYCDCPCDVDHDCTADCDCDPQC